MRASLGPSAFHLVFVEPKKEGNSTHMSIKKIDTIHRFFAAYALHDLYGIRDILAVDVEWTIPGHHPLSGVKRGVDEVVAFFDELSEAGFQAEPIFVGESDDYVVDIHRGWTTRGAGQVDTMWALVWRFDEDGKVEAVWNLSGDQHQMDAFCWANYQLAPIPQRLA